MAKIFKVAAESLAKVAKGAEERSYGSRLPDDEVSKLPGGDMVIKAMPNDDFMALNKTLEKAGFQQGLNVQRIGEIFNMEPGDFDIEKLLTNIKENNKSLFNEMRREQRSMDAMMAAAEKLALMRSSISFSTGKRVSSKIQMRFWRPGCSHTAWQRYAVWGQASAGYDR